MAIPDNLIKRILDKFDIKHKTAITPKISYKTRIIPLSGENVTYRMMDAKECQEHLESLLDDKDDAISSSVRALNELYDFRDRYLGMVQTHDLVACQAYKAYHKYQDERDAIMFEQIPFKKGFINGRRLNTPFVKYISMNDFAWQYGTTVEEMKKHWRCVDDC